MLNHLAAKQAWWLDLWNATSELLVVILVGVWTLSFFICNVCNNLDANVASLKCVGFFPWVFCGGFSNVLSHTTNQCSPSNI